ncbi:MAG TPA: hypothetical protein DEG43_01340 [Acidimicrobiaceae bacterium]|nr:hypothetical protein [Acidimicrobiaceae bacterium]
MGLEDQARSFAAQTSVLLNKTVADGIRISSITTPAGYTVMGCGVTSKAPNPKPFVLGVSGKRCVWLYLQHSYDWDPEQVHLTMTRSTLSLYTSEEMADDQLVLGIDYIRNPANQYPGCHLHVSGSRDDLDLIYLGEDRDSRKLRDLHLPVGGRRFRPTLEDLIEFVVTEEMATPRDNWRDVLDEHRELWDAIQVKAAVRRHQESAAESLAAQGWTVSPPPDR